MLPSYEPEAVLSHKNGSYEGFSFCSGEKIEFSSSEMVNFVNYVLKYEKVRPRTFWIEFPYFTVVQNSRQRFQLGYRPQDLTQIDTIERKAWKKHQAHLNRLERFPLEKAEYYARLKESYGVDTVRALSKVTGEDWSYIARILRILDLTESIKEFLKSNKNDPAILKFFHLRRLIEIVRERDERLQLARFNEIMEEFEESRLMV